MFEPFEKRLLEVLLEFLQPGSDVSAIYLWDFEEDAARVFKIAQAACDDFVDHQIFGGGIPNPGSSDIDPARSLDRLPLVKRERKDEVDANATWRVETGKQQGALDKTGRFADEHVPGGSDSV
ncbi:MAG: hypothetical protein ACRD3T_09810 [Terriglobia bacterium]